MPDARNVDVLQSNQIPIIINARSAVTLRLRNIIGTNMKEIIVVIMLLIDRAGKYAKTRPVFQGVC